MKHIVSILCLALLLGMTGFPLGPARVAAGPAETAALPKPDMSGGMPLMEALAKRRSTRTVSGEPISERDLSNLLWAAWGINRPDGKRTVPTARNRQDARVFAVLESGVWLYDAAANALVKAVDIDARSRFGGAPLTLLYAARADDETGGMHVGSMYQNVALYCASVGLGDVVKITGRGGLDSALKLPEGYKILVAHSIGRPK
ncbi:MAG: nitroreductase family protein [Desulfovibrio sp.]|nr:nitroreductase family protein [Desulfovibrio sp.]